MEIIRGKIPCAKKVVIYGPEGIGKSTFASQFPDPVFIDTEGSTNSMDVARLPKASSWQMILQQVDYVRTHPEVCKTLVIDTIDGVHFRVRREECQHVRSLDAQRAMKKTIYGAGLLLSDQAAARKQNAEKQAAEKAAEDTICYELSERERELVEELNKSTLY